MYQNRHLHVEKCEVFEDRDTSTKPKLYHKLGTSTFSTF